MEISLDIIVENLSIEFDAKTNIPAGETVEIPTITIIDGGDSTNDTQFTPVNGILDGCGA